MIVGAILMSSLGAGIFWYISREEPAPAPNGGDPPQVAIVSPEPAEIAVEVDVEVEEEPPTPPQKVKRTAPSVVEERVVKLDQSDSELRDLLSQLGPQPELGEWLMMRDLVRSFVVVVDNIAEGRSPRPHLAEMEPPGRFSVREEGDRFFIDPASYQRFDLISEVFVNFDIDDAVAIYIDAYPLMQQAYEELGYPEQSFDNTLERAITELLAVPRLVGPVELEALIVTYAFADFELEALTAAQKQFLRMGAVNVARIQARLRTLAGALGMDTAELPPPTEHIPRSFDESNPTPLN